MELFWVSVKGALVGLAAVVPFGPVNTELARRTLRGGILSGVMLGLGAVFIDAMLALLAGLGVSVSIPKDAPWRLPLIGGAAIFFGVLGGVSLTQAYIAYSSPKRELNEHQSLDTPINPVSSFMRGVTMTLLNPLNYAFWMVAVPSVGLLHDNPRYLPMFVIAVGVAATTWVISLAFGIRYLQQRSGSGIVIVADVIGGLTLIACGLLAIGELVRT